MKNRLLNSSIVFFVFLTLMSYGQEEPKTHIVRPLDNYYSLSLRYDLTIEELKSANPGIHTPRPGDTLVIPVRGYLEPVAIKTDCDRLRVRKPVTYRVALLIPFYLEQAAVTNWAKKLDPSNISEVAPFRFIQFYHGFMLAADSLRKQGMDIEIHVFDVDHQASKAAKALRDPVMKRVDLIVGPFHQVSFSLVADFAKKQKIPLVNPVTTRSEIIDDNPYVFKLIPPAESQMAMVAKLVRRDFAGHKIIIYTANKFQGAETVERLKNTIETDAGYLRYPITMTDYQSDSISGFMKNATKEAPNLVIIYTEIETLPAALLSKLSAQRNKYAITVLALPNWERFNNLETKYMLDLNAHIILSSYVDHEDENVKAFLREYRSRYLDEPMGYACSGFDAGYYFLQALSLYGESFMRCIEYINFPLLQNQYDFEHLNGSGFENIHWKILRYANYQLHDRSIQKY
ncbi:MAG: ABC transporter substrate-binding protein [Bacteroidales bacterium]|nr:ABC transporter substrate-binding protein [Bacteroidales bacterium]